MALRQLQLSLMTITRQFAERRAMKNIKLSRKQAGDTIIEVMMAMAVIGLSLGTAYGIANRAVIQGRQAQERSEALKVAESQIERLKANIASGAVLRSEYENTAEFFCINESETRREVTYTETSPGVYTVNACLDPGGFYKYFMVYQDTPVPNFVSVVEWDNPTGQEPSRLEIVYRP